MYHRALCLCNPSVFKLGPNIREKLLKSLLNVCAPYQVGNDGTIVQDLLSWEDYHAKEVGRRSLDPEGVVISNLPETLETHRAQNRTSVIRKIEVSLGIATPFYRPLLQIIKDNGENPNRTFTASPPLGENEGESRVGGQRCKGREEESTGSALTWPTDSIQARRTLGKNGRRRDWTFHGNSHTNSDDVIEYVGKPLVPTTSWKIREDSVSLLQRPWLAYLMDSGGDNFQRSVISPLDHSPHLP